MSVLRSNVFVYCVNSLRVRVGAGIRTRGQEGQHLILRRGNALRVEVMKTGYLCEAAISSEDTADLLGLSGSLQPQHVVSDS
jgi:hypothetical protein